jgi:hypothetical protein
VETIYSKFPGGRVGLALFLLRLVDGVGLVGEGIHLTAASSQPTVVVLLSLVLVASAILLILGLRTSVAGGAAAIATLGAGLYGTSHVDLFANDVDAWLGLFALVFCLSISIGLLGPGSYSLDAQLSGWRRITLPPYTSDGPNEWDTWC